MIISLKYKIKTNNYYISKESDKFYFKTINLKLILLNFTLIFESKYAKKINIFYNFMKDL